MTRAVRLATLCFLLLTPPLLAQTPPKTPPANQAQVYMSAKGLTQTSPKQYWIFRKGVCVKAPLAGKVESLAPGSYQIRVGFPSGYLLHEAELKAGEKYVIPTGLLTFREVTPTDMLTSVPQELYSGDTYLVTGYQGATARLLPGKYTVCYQDWKSDKPSQGLSSWYVIGAFPSPNPQKAYDTVFSPEKDKTVRPDQPHARPDGAERRWQKLDGNPDLALTDVMGQEWIVAYAATTIESETDREAQLLLFLRGSMKVWLNGQLIHSFQVTRLTPPQNRHLMFIKLKKGKNDLFIKSLRSSNDWPLAATIVNCKTYHVTVEAEKE